MRLRALLVIGTLIIAVRPAHGDRCDELSKMSCEKGAGEKVDPTGSTFPYDQERALKQVIDQKTDKITLAAKELVASSDSAALAAKLNVRCGEATQCTGAVAAALTEVFKADLSNGAAGNLKSLGLTLEKARAVTSSSEYEQAKDALMKTIRNSPDPNREAELRDKKVPEIARDLVEVIKKHLPDTAARAALVKRVSGVKYAGDVCKAFLMGGHHPVVLAQINAFYDPDGNQIRVCRGMLNSMSSDYALTATIAHEIGHAVEPCTQFETASVVPKTKTIAQRDRATPWSNLVECLRSKDSIQAKADPSHVEAKDCRSDQIVEGIPDFLAMEVLGMRLARKSLGEANPDETFKGLANVWRVACTAPSYSSDPHSSPAYRIERLLALQPEVRKALHCGVIPPGKKYCGDGSKNEGRAQPRKTTR